MNRTLIFFITGLVLLSGHTRADLSWDAPAENLSTYGIQAGWLVLMYHDVNSNSVLSTIVFDKTGAVVGGTGAGDDNAMGSEYQTLTVDLDPDPLIDDIQFSSVPYMVNETL